MVGNCFRLAIIELEDFGRKIGKRTWFRNKASNFSVESQTITRQLGMGNEWNVSNNLSGIPKSQDGGMKNSGNGSNIGIPGLEHIDYTCRNREDSNINLTLSNAVGRLKIDWKQFIWMVRHGLKNKNTVSNNWETKLQSRIGTRDVLAITDKRSNWQVGTQNSNGICKYASWE
jgi:hypothetical protein